MVRGQWKGPRLLSATLVGNSTRFASLMSCTYDPHNVAKQRLYVVLHSEVSLALRRVSDAADDTMAVRCPVFSETTLIQKVIHTWTSSLPGRCVGIV